MVYPSPALKDGAASPGLFPKEDLDQLAADPDTVGARLMEKLDQNLCRPRPEGYTLDWSTYLQSHHGGTGAAWLTLWARQLIDGVRAENQSCNMHFNRKGELLNLHCRLLAQANAALPAEDWPDEEEVIRVAEAAYLAELRNLAGPGQKVESIERVYRGGAPTLIAKHAGCGETVVNAITLDARYGCQYGWPERPHHGIAEGESVVHLDGLPPYFEDRAFAVAGGSGYLLSGSVQRPWTDPSGYDYEPGNYLLAFDAAGQLRWRYRLAASRAVEAIVPTGDDLLLWQREHDPDGNRRAVSVKVSMTDGTPLGPEREFEVPPYRGTLPDETGLRLYTVREIGPRWQIWAQDRDGTILWRVDLPGGVSEDGLTRVKEGGLAVLSRAASNDSRRYEVRHIDHNGQLLLRAEIASAERFDASLLGLDGGRAFLLTQSAGDDHRGLSEMLVYSIADGGLLQRHLVPDNRALKWLPGGKLLHLGGEGGWALLGEIGENGPWRRHFGFGVQAQYLTQAAVPANGKLALLAQLDYQRNSSVTPDRRAILQLDMATVGKQGRSANCPMVSHETLRILEQALWRDFHVFPDPTLLDYRPNLDCIDSHRAHYRDFLQTLHDDLTERGYRAPGFFVHLTVEPGQRGLRLRGGGAGHGGVRRGQQSPKLRVHFSDAARLAAYLQDTLEPHSRTVYRLLDDFRVHTGAELNLAYSREGEAADLDKLASNLRRVLEVIRAIPYSAFPEFGESAPLLLELDDVAVSPVNHREQLLGASVFVANLGTEELKSLMHDAARAISGGPELPADDGENPAARDSYGNSALHRAALQGARTALPELSADEALANATAYDGATPLHRAVFSPRFPAPLLEPLVRAQRDINARTIDGETALHLAVHTPEVVKLLLEAGANPNARDERGATPLHRAAAVWLGEQSVKALLAAGADPALRDDEGSTPQMIAEQRRLPANAGLLAGRAAP
ncbi:ankyrin repeat domain-containing protein [Haliea sp. E1-2-M8]|nr:ankyrin repeat domain-containing protein [Haliea sp. E1-2-M8]